MLYLAGIIIECFTFTVEQVNDHCGMTAELGIIYPTATGQVGK
jgi:hypothetical protein